MAEHPAGDARQYRGLAAVTDPAAAAHHRRSPGDRIIDMGFDPCTLPRVDDRSDHGRRIAQVAHAERRSRRREAREELRGDAALHIDAARSHADLALIPERPLHRGLHRARQVGVVEHDERTLAAEFQRQLLARARRELTDVRTDARRTCEADAAHERMTGQRVADLVTETRHHVEATGRQPCFLVDLGEAQRHQRRFLGRQHHHRVAEGQRDRAEPRAFAQRHVEGRDARHHADGHAEGQVHLAGHIARQGLAGEVPCRAGGRAEHVRGTLHLVTGLADR